MFKKINLITNFNSENIFQVIKDDIKIISHFSFKNIIEVIKKNNRIEDLNIILYLQTSTNENDYIKKIIKETQKKNNKAINILVPAFYNMNQILPISINDKFFSFQKNFFEYLKSVNKNYINNFHLVDFLYLCNVYNDQVFNLKRWYMSKNIFTFDFELYLSKNIISIITLIKQKRKKAIFVDLDDTLWGGTIAEDDLKKIKLGNMSSEGEAFQDFQMLLKNYTTTGIILGIVSRNYEKKALNFITSHPEMILKKKDFAGWKINFNNKSDNINELCKELNLKMDSVIFLDNSTYERQEVKDKLKDIEVLNIGDNIFDYSNKLKGYFDINFLNLNKEDLKRAENYTQIRNLNESQKKFSTHEDWLKSLNMKIEFESYNKLQIERYHQMYNRINQINLSSRRLSIEKIKKELKNNMKIVTLRVEDKVTNLGIIGLISYYEKKNMIIIGDFLFSCRALGRDLEKYFIAKIVNKLLYLNKKIKFNFKKTSKNQLCTEILNKLKIEIKNNYIIEKKISPIYKKNIFLKETEKY
jgi:FkbH-like protein